jgi:hypothetical protein
VNSYQIQMGWCPLLVGFKSVRLCATCLLLLLPPVPVFCLQD